MSIPLDKTPERDGQTNKQTDGQADMLIFSGYYSGLHCEQRGRAVKKQHHKT